MDDSGYVSNAVQKIKLYENNGIFVGDRLILTFETKKMALNTSDIERIVDRLVTADYKLKKGKPSFILYLFSTMALIDLMSILPSFIAINKGIKILRITRIIRTFKVFRVFKGVWNLSYKRDINIHSH